MLRLTIKVIPGSGRQKCFLNKQGRLCCYLKSQPERGKANKELIQFLAKKCKLTQKELCIVHGETYRMKVIQFPQHFTQETVYHSLGITEMQQTILEK